MYACVNHFENNDLLKMTWFRYGDILSTSEIRYIKGLKICDIRHIVPPLDMLEST